MKQIFSTSGNFIGMFTPPFPADGGKHEMAVMVEVILTTMEPCRVLEASKDEPDKAEVVKTHKIDDFRFVGTPQALRKFASALQELADQAEEMQSEFANVSE